MLKTGIGVTAVLLSSTAIAQQPQPMFLTRKSKKLACLSKFTSDTAYQSKRARDLDIGSPSTKWRKNPPRFDRIENAARQGGVDWS
jgi:hypothetical protein